ncbi:helix-turn-helix transcriptional regulator [Streptomyces sp. NPDC057411]|uniref:helix-turn-helix domain-containing protein n=1 Tax=unclassified Streptomyces TaxID=2593676 RepID=UPI0036262047
MQRQRDPLRRLSPRERKVLALIAEGHSNAAIAPHPHPDPTEAGVGEHIGNLLAKLGLPVNNDTNRCVQAVLTYPKGRQPGSRASGPRPPRGGDPSRPSVAPGPDRRQDRGLREGGFSDVALHGWPA